MRYATPQPDGMDVAAVTKLLHVVDDIGGQVVRLLRNANHRDAIGIEYLVHYFASRCEWVPIVTESGQNANPRTLDFVVE